MYQKYMLEQIPQITKQSQQFLLAIKPNQLQDKYEQALRPVYWIYLADVLPKAAINN